MQFLIIIVLLNISPSLLLTNNEESLHKYKSEIHKIGSDVENFIFDVAKDIFTNADTLFNFDYKENDKSEEENPNFINAINKENSESYEEDPTNNAIEYTKKKKRSIDYSFSQEQPMPIDNYVGAIPNSKCIEKNGEDKILEEMHIKEIKEELVKLYELVGILKDQQTMLSLLDKKEKGLSQESDPKSLLNVLEHINNNLNEEKERNKKLPTHKELEQLKFDLRKAISNLSQTKNILKEEKEKESTLELKIIHQQEQIDLLKSLLDKIISDSVSTKPTQYSIENVIQTEDRHSKVSDLTTNNDKEIVGVPMFIPEDLPQLLKSGKDTKKDISKRTDDIKNRKIISTTEELKQTRKASVSNNPNPVKTELNKNTATYAKKENSTIPGKPHKIRSSEVETQLGELEKRMEKQQSKEDNIKREMTLLRKLLESEKPSSRTFSDNDVDFLKSLLKLTDSSGKPQGKSDDIEDELKKLENSINILKPSAEVKLLDFPSTKINPQTKGSTVTLSTDQIIELRKKLDEIIDIQAKRDIKNILSIGGSSRNLDSPKGSFPYPMWYRPFATDGMPPSFDFPYYPNLFNPFYPPPPYEQQEYFNNGYGQNTYDYGSSYESIPYQQNSSDVKNNVFQDTQIAPIDKHIEEFRFNEEEDDRRLSQQQRTNRLHNNYDLNTKIKVINDLKMEINSLEMRIANLKSQADTGKFEDKSSIDELEKEIQELKSIFNHSSQEVKPITEDSKQNDHEVHQQRHKRSTENGETSKKISLDEQTDVQLYDDLTSKLREYLVEDTSTKARTAEYEDIRGRINKLKSQLGYSPMIRDLKKSPFESNYQPPKYEYNKGVTSNIKIPAIPPKKDDIFTSMIEKVLDKVIALIPKILGKLFGKSIEGLVDKIEYDKYAYGYEKQYNLESTFYSLGAFGYIPLIILKLVNGLSTFVSILKKNIFFKNFLVPAFVLLIVSGAVIFLIWWFKDDQTNSLRQIGFDNHRMSSEDFNNYRSVHTGTDYFNNFKSVPYPMKFYPYYYKNYPYLNSKEIDSRTVNNMVPGLYYRTYFENGSKKH